MSEIPDTAKKPQDHRIKVEGKSFHWTTEEGTTLTIPLTIKVRVLRELNDLVLDADGMYQMIVAIAPEQADTIDEMDVNDFQAAYAAWQATYNEGAGGASLGESSGSSN